MRTKVAGRRIVSPPAHQPLMKDENMQVITIQNITKQYDDTPVLADITATIEQGEVFGIYGAKGSGKTTLLRILMHFLFPTSGQAAILGKDVTKEANEVHKRTAFIPEDPVFYDNLSVAETIRYGIGKVLNSTMVQQRKALLESFALDPKAMGWELSRRERSKLAAIIALLRNPPVYLLDSPFTHLAPVERANLVKHLHAAKKAGATMILTSTDSADLLSLCDRISHLQGGVLERPQSIEAHLENQGVFVITHGDLSHKEVSALAYRIVVSTDTEKQFFYRGDTNRLLTLLASRNIHNVQIIEAASADLYTQHFGGQA